MTKYERIRIAKAEIYLENTADSGRFGRAFELECARPASRKSTVSKQGKTDVSVKILRNGKACYIPCECKTNGGRIDDLLSGENKSSFIIYRLEFVQKHKASKSKPEWNEVRQIPATLIPTALFLQMLKECNAIKEVAHNGIVDGLAIQPSSKKMFERLTAYIENYGESVLFNNTKAYEDWELEGLEL
jgi:hypothetical protein